jgi:hypothetical protein
MHTILIYPPPPQKKLKLENWACLKFESALFSKQHGINILVPLEQIQIVFAFFSVNTGYTDYCCYILFDRHKMRTVSYILLLANSFILLLNSKVVFYNYFKTNIICLLLPPPV